LARELQRDSSWQIIMMHDDSPAQTLQRNVRRENPDAIVMRPTKPKLLECFDPLSIPVVAVAFKKSDVLSWPHVLPDDEAIGRMAADYLLDQRFDHFGLAGFTSIADEPRMAVFRERIQLALKSLDEFFIPTPTERLDHPASLGGNPHALLRWLQNLPKPCALFAHSDQPAAYIIRICMEHGIRVPDDISVLGVDDDALFCHTVYPNLSSIHVSNIQLGVEAARIILDWKAGQRIVKVPPTIVIERESVRSKTIKDTQVKMAIEYLRAHISKGIHSADLQKLTGLSAQVLIYRFRHATGQTPMAIILGERISHARKLLHETDKPITLVSSECGFRSMNQFFVTFRKAVGISPKRYREQFKV
jgi:LacI family transcriptional regulator